MSGTVSNAGHLDAIIAQYLKRLDRGEHVDRERFIAAHRDFAAELRQFLADLDCIDRQVEKYNLLEEDTADELTGTFSGQDVPKSFIRLDATHSVGKGTDNRFFFGDYELLQELGRGAMGVVFKARHRHMDRVGDSVAFYSSRRKGSTRYWRIQVLLTDTTLQS